MEYIVVDCETTGLNPRTNRVIEIAALRCRGPLVIDRFETLIDPQHPIPRMIRQLTGISTEMVQGAPPAAPAMADFLLFVGGSLLVGHNVRFDLNFLGAEAQRHHGTRLANPSLCTIRLAARLLPNLRRPNLDNLARALELQTQDRHRAMGDAGVTQQAFCRLVDRARERGITTQGGLLALAGPSAGSARAVGGRGTGRLLLNPELRRGLPERPGVYLMKDERGTIIYVGKAKNLKQRVSSYYSQPLGYKRKMDGLLESVRELETIVVGSELEALILESRRIKEHQPQFNVQQRYYRHYPFIKVDVTSPFPRVFATREVKDDGARYFGPFRSKQAVDTVVDLVHRLFPVRSCTRIVAPDGRHRGKASACLRFHVGRCLGPCMGAVTPEAYGTVIGEVLSFLAGGQDAMLARVELEMRRSADRLDFERSARLRDALRQARQVMVSQQLLMGAIEHNNLVIICPGVEEESAELFGIRHGRLFEQLALSNVDDLDTRAAVSAFLARLHAAAAAPPVVGQEEVDAIIIIGRWLARYGDSPRVLRLEEGYGEETVDRFVRILRSDVIRPEYNNDLWHEEESDD
jgi:DNA polymerase-3 subunit epsilon